MSTWVLPCMHRRRYNIKQLLGERNHLGSTATLRHQIGELKMVYKSRLAATDPRALRQPDGQHHLRAASASRLPAGQGALGKFASSNRNCCPLVILTQA